MSGLLAVGTLADVTKRKRVVVEHEGVGILVLAHEGSLYALDNICIHKQRELVKGVVLNGKLVCPGHQWAFQLGTGYEAVKDRCQPTYDVVVDGDHVFVDLSTRRADPPSVEQTTSAHPTDA